MRVEDLPSPAPEHEAASAAVTAAFSLLPYPISKDMAIEALGSWPIPLGRESVPLGRMLDLLPEEDFEGPMDAVRAMDRHWRDIERDLRQR
jgi:hypothetical protein